MNICPIYFKDFIFNRRVIKILEPYTKYTLDNIILHGPANIGKKTIIKAFINHLHGRDVSSETTTCSFEIPINSNKLTINYSQSRYHIEINLYEYGYNDKNVIILFLKHILEYHNIVDAFPKLVIINHAEKISRSGQLSLRYALDKYYKNGKFILCTENLDIVDSSLRSRLTEIRVSRPKKDELIRYIRCKLKEKKKRCIKKNIHLLIENSHNNLYKLNILLEHYIETREIASGLFSNSQIVDTFIPYIYEKTLDSMVHIKNEIYISLLKNIKPSEILTIISAYFTQSFFPNEFIYEIIKYSAELDTMRPKIMYDIYMLECFVLKIKDLLNTYPNIRCETKHIKS